VSDLRAGLTGLFRDTAAVSLAYISAFCVTFEVLMPVQNALFPDFSSRASLLFLPHGVRVLSAWLLGWRSVIALLPGVFAVFWWVAGEGVFTPSRLAAMAVAVTVPALAFHIARRLHFPVTPRSRLTPCWPCIMGMGVVISVAGSLLTNLAFGSPMQDYIAYLIGDIFGLFFLMALLMYLFRALRRRAG
jgi:hypothetical protein